MFRWCSVERLSKYFVGSDWPLNYVLLRSEKMWYPLPPPRPPPAHTSTRRQAHTPIHTNIHTAADTHTLADTTYPPSWRVRRDLEQERVVVGADAGALESRSVIDSDSHAPRDTEHFNDTRVRFEVLRRTTTTKETNVETNKRLMQAGCACKTTPRNA